MFGKSLVVLYDQRKDSPTFGKHQGFVLTAPPETQEEYDKIPENEKPILLKIPPLVVHGFGALSKHGSIINNIPDIAYNYKDPDEHRFKWNDESIPYKWPKHITRGG